MNVLHILWRNIIHRKTLSFLTALSITITIALIVILLQASGGAEQSAKKGYGPFELTIGAKGSSTQLVLNTYYRIGTPIGNIPLEVFRQVQQEAATANAYAITAGDSFNGYPIVGIDPAYFLTRYGNRNLKEGTLYTSTGQVIVGSHIARMLDLKVGDTFHGSHGLVQGSGASYDAQTEHEDEAHSEGNEHEQFEYTVTGILPTLGTADDRTVFTTLDYAWQVHGISKEEDKMVTSIMVQPKDLIGAQLLKNKFDNSTYVQAAYTSKSVAEVMNMVDTGTELIGFISILCVVLASISLLLSLTSVVLERKKDVGLMRIIGKSRLFVWSVLIGEGLFLTLTGITAGLILGHLMTYLLSSSIFEWTGIQVNALHFVSGEGWLIIGALLIGFASSIGPSIKVYRVDPLHLFRS
jgi:putative ABC transport system permease protein